MALVCVMIIKMVTELAKKTFQIGTSFLIIIAFFAFTKASFAADPSFIVSWKANNHVPMNYLGKVLPISGSEVDISFEMVGNNPGDSGKIINLSNNEVRWYVNGTFMKSGQNMKSFSFVTSDGNGTETDVKISAEYNDPTTQQNYFVNEYIAIPLTFPDVVISYKNFSGSLIKGNANLFSAIPFFFNSALDSLSILWTVNNQQATSDYKDPWNLTVNLGSDYPSGSDININAVVQDRTNSQSSASKTYHFNSE